MTKSTKELTWHPPAPAPGDDIKLMGIPVMAYRRPGGDASNGGISAKYDRFILVGEGMPEIFEATDNMPALVLIIRDLDGEYLHAEPVFPPDPGSVGWVFGGNFVFTSDSRATRYPVPVHDRQETQAQSDILSN